MRLWIARHLRSCAQWLDPLPDDTARWHDLVEDLRASLRLHVENLAHAEAAHEHAMADMTVTLGNTQQEVLEARAASAALALLHAHCLPVPHDDVFARAKTLTVDAETHRTTSGEWKHHTVFAQLLKEFPEQDARSLHLAIEAALRWP